MNAISTKSTFRKMFIILIMASFSTMGFSQGLQDLAPGVTTTPNTSNPSAEFTKPAASQFLLDKPGSTSPPIDAMWDIQFNYNINDSIPSSLGLAGALLVGTEFWISQWQGDSLYRMSSTGAYLGQFTINDGAGGTVIGTRAMTTDGTSIYIGNASATIFEVDPATQTVTNTITSQGATARFITYDPTADGGNGGFWIGNFSTDLDLISRTGAVLNTLPGTAIGGKYGAAYDGISMGGPYLWVFAQSGGNGTGLIHQVQISSGIEVSAPHDVNADFGAGSAGGLFISNQLVPGKNTLGGLFQGNSVFGYELDFIPPQIDAELVALGHTPPYGHYPARFEPSFTFGGSIRNNGAQALTNLSVDLSIDQGGSSIHTDFAASAGPVNNLGIFNFAFPYTFGDTPGDFSVNLTANTGSQTDENTVNNGGALAIFTTDSVLARDDNFHVGPPQGGIGISGTDAGTLVVLYDFTEDMYVSGLQVQLEDPGAIHGESFTVSVTLVNRATDPIAPPTGPPTAFSLPVTVDSTLSNVYYVPFFSPLQVAAGQTWAMGVDEGTFNIELSYSDLYFINDVVYFTTDNGTSWTDVNSFGIIPFIRPVVPTCDGFSLDLTSVPFNSDLNQTGEVTADPTGALGTVTYSWDDPNSSTTPSVSDLQPGTYTVTASDGNGCSVTASVDVTNTTSIEDDLAAGINNFQIYPNPTKGVVNLNIEMSEVSDLGISIIDMNGRTVYQESHQKVNVYSKALNLSSLSRGVYMLEAITAKGRTFKRVVLD